MSKKRTNWTDLSEEGAGVLINIVSESNWKEAHTTLDKMLEYVGEEKFILAMHYVYEVFVCDALTNKNSPVHSVLRQIMAQISERTMEDLHRSHTKIESLQEEIKVLHSELEHLHSRVRFLEATLASVRRCLKSDRAKQCLEYCRRFRRKPPIGETERVANELAEILKHARICIRGV